MGATQVAFKGGQRDILYPVLCNALAGSMTRFNTARSKEGIVSYTRAAGGLRGGAMAEAEKDSAMSILEEVIDLDAASEAVKGVRECRLLGHENAHAFVDVKDAWLDEAGNDPSAHRSRSHGTPFGTPVTRGVQRIGNFGQSYTPSLCHAYSPPFLESDSHAL